MSVAFGPTDRKERDATHFGWSRHAAANSRSSSLHGIVDIPIAHDLVQAAAIDAADLLAHLLDEVTEERGAAEGLVVDVAIQGLVHSEDERRQAATPPARWFLTKRATCGAPT